MGVALVLVTFLASQFIVSEPEHEFGFAMIESGFLPAFFVMAVAALIAKIAFVLVDFAVTGHAFDRRFAVLEPARMAGVAGFLLVFAAQRKIGPGVVETFLVQPHDPGTPAFVLCMTLPAVLLLEAAMKSQTGPDIRSDRLMAFKA